MDKKVLVLGATGALGTYLVSELLERGYWVVGVSLDDAVSYHERLTYLKGDASDPVYLRGLMQTRYNAVVDFMIYDTIEKFSRVYRTFLDNTDHYVFLSTYRVYAGEYPITEDSPRMLDIQRPEGYRCYKDYSIYKAQGEDLLRSSGYHNYTIVRPAITFSKRRFQLTTLEANVIVYRMMTGKTVVLPEEAMERQATMNWSGDVAKMFAAIIEKPGQSMGQAYTLATAEHHSWREVAEMYGRIGGLKYVTTDTETFLDLTADGSVYSRQQLLYDRCYDRVVDNSKILALAGLKQEELMGLEEGLAMELSHIRLEDVGCNERVNRRMDEYLAKLGLE